VATSVSVPRFRPLLVAVFGIMALLLAAVGVYSLVSCAASQRMREMSIRLALGASPGHVVRQSMRRGVVLAAAGTMAGVAVSLPAMRLLSSLLFDVGAADPLTYGAVAAGLLAVATLASYVPARRSARVDPAVARRAE
jgi:putative ABC transport system permease protein